MAHNLKDKRHLCAARKRDEAFKSQCVRCPCLCLKMGIEDYHVRPDVLTRIKAVLNDSSYRDVIESSSQYNNGIVGERKLRLPYLDSQTGVAQSDCFLWMQKADRMPGQSFGQLYTYPSKRWKKKRRQYLMNDNYLTRTRQAREHESTAAGGGGCSAGGSSEVNEISHQSVVANSSSSSNDNSAAIKPENNDSADKFSYDNSKETWYQDFDDGSDLPDAGELDDPESDFDDYEEYSSSKSKKKKKKNETPKRKRVEYSDAEKPYSCDLCGARYKTRPGLSYHYSHSHQNEGGSALAVGGRPGEEGGEGPPSPYSMSRSSVHTNPNGPSSSQGMPNSQGPLPPTQHPHGTHGGPPQLTPQMPGMLAGAPGGLMHRASPIPQMPSAAGPPALVPPRERSEDAFEGKPSGKPLASPSSYCDFCLGKTDCLIAS